MCCFITTHETSYKVRAVDSSGLKQNNPIFKIRLANTYIQHLNILHHPFSHCPWHFGSRNCWKESTMASEDRNYTWNYWNTNLFTQQPTPHNQNIEHKHLPNKLGHRWAIRACYSDLPRLLITSGCRVNNASSAGVQMGTWCKGKELEPKQSTHFWHKCFAGFHLQIDLKT